MRLAIVTVEPIEKESSFLALASGLRKSGYEVNIHDQTIDLLSVGGDSDAIIIHPQFIFEAIGLSEKLPQPIIVLLPSPVIPETAAFPYSHIRRFAFRFMQRWIDRTYRQYFKTLVKNLQPFPSIHAYSNALIPNAKDWSDEHNRIIGVIKLSDQQLRPLRKNEWLKGSLDAWLQQGPAPIYVDLSGMSEADLHRMIVMVIDIAERFGMRAIIECAWTAPPTGYREREIPERIFMLPTGEHSWLFPRCSCVMHPGEAGMTHAVIESGIPSIIYSVRTDQSFWGGIIARHNIGRHIPAAKLSPTRLIRAIRDLQSDAVRNHVEEIGKQMRAENGLHNALNWIEQILSPQ